MRKTGMRFSLTRYSSPEAEHIVGISERTLRDWLRYLRREEDDAAFDVFVVAELLAMKALADHGISPERTADSGTAYRCATSVVWFAVQNAMEAGKERHATGGRLWRSGLTWLIKKGIRPRCGGLMPPPRFCPIDGGEKRTSAPVLDREPLGAMLAERTTRSFGQPG